MSGIAESAFVTAFLDLRTSAVQPQTPLVSGAVPAMAMTLWKMMQANEYQAEGLAVFSISRVVK